MRWLGVDSTRPATDVERILMLKLHNRVVSEEKRSQKGAT